MASNPRSFKHPIPRSGSDTPKPVGLIEPDAVLKALKDDDDIVQVNWNGLTIAVRSMISVDEMHKLFEFVLEQCWNGELYLVEMADFTLRSAIVTFYSNVVLPDDNDMRRRIVYCKDFYETIKKNINEGQYKAIEDAVRIYFEKT